MAELKVAVRYFSKSGNTKKVADAIAKAADCNAESIPKPLTGYTDILFLGASVYWGGIADEVKKYITGLNCKTIGKVVIFSTSALTQRAYPQIKKYLQKNNICVDDENFYCRGQFTALHKGHPDENDLTAATQFTNNLLQKGK